MVILDLVHEPEGYVVVSDLVTVLEGQVVGLGLVPQVGEEVLVLDVHAVQPLTLVVSEGLAVEGEVL